MRKRAFTLVEVVIVVLIIGILLAIAIPNMITARDTSTRKTCQSNMRVYDTVKEQWAMEQKIPNGTPATFADVRPYLRRVPVCPSGGTYDLTTIGAQTRCSLPEHPTY